MNNINLFKSHVELFNSSVSNNDKHTIVKTSIIPKIMESDKGYFGGMLLFMNSNFETFKVILRFIGSSPEVDLSRKFFILKRFLIISSKLTLEKKLHLTEALWDINEFRACFQFFNLSIKSNSKEEKTNGPFCSLFSDKWTDDFTQYIDALTPLMRDTSAVNNILSYAENFAKLNTAYLENDPETIQNSCSSVDFNTNMIYILIHLQQYVNNDQHKHYWEVTGKAFNIMYISLVTIKNSVENQLMQHKGTPNENFIKQSLNRITTIYTDETINEFILSNIVEIVKSMDTTFELDNMCMFLLDKYSSDYSNFT